MKINSKFTRIVGVGLSTAMLATTVLTAVPAMALTAPVVTINNTGISQVASWDIRFTVNTAVNGADGSINITWPSGFTMSNNASVTNITIAAGPGWTSPTTFGAPTLAGIVVSSNASARRFMLDFSATDVIGADAQVRIIIPEGITNPSLPGSYNISVVTTNETTAQTSNNVVITLPNIGPLPGQVEGKNSNGDVLYRNIVADLSTVIATPGVSRIELSAGTYNASNVAGIIGQTIIGVGAAGTVIMTAPAGSTPLTVSAINVTLQNLTFQGNPNSVDNLLAITANNTNIVNSTFNGGVNQIVVAYPASVSSNRTTISDCILNVTGNVTAGVVSNGRVTTNSTYNVDLGGTAIAASNGGLTVAANAKFNGTSGAGTGIVITTLTGAGASTITSATFTNLGNNALVSGGNATNSVQVSSSTFTGCGNSTATSSTLDGVITANSTGADLILINNTISNSAAAAYGIYVSGGNVTARFNTITNTLNVKRTSGTADAVNNWWGSANGPSSSSLSGTVATTPFLTAITNSASNVFVTSNLSGGTPGGLPSGVDVTSTNATTGASLNWTMASVAKYATNPQSTAPSGTVLGYYDVYVAGASTESGSTITIKFYVPGLTADSKVYYGGGLAGAWTLASNQGVNTASGFAFLTVTGATAPSIADLDGTPFVVTNVVSAPAAPSLLGPAAGTTSIPVNTGFSWAPVTGATSYNFQVSTASNFATTISSQTGLTTTVAGGIALSANTTYFWRVQAVNAGGTSAWSASTFTTAGAASGTTTPPPVTVNVTPQAPVINVAPPNVTVQPPAVTINPPQVTVAAPPPANVTVNPPTVNVAPPPPANVQVNVPESGPIIPTYILWTIILIGAVLVIALIVLIVRTRRVA